MRNSFQLLWDWLFICLVQFPIAAAVGAIVGRTDLSIWAMGVVAHLAVRSVRGLPFGQRLAIWSSSMIAGGVTIGLGSIVPNLLTRATADDVLSTSGHVTSLFWFVAAIRLAINWAPVVVTWVAGAIIIRRWSGRRDDASPPLATVKRDQDVRGRRESNQSQEGSSLRAGLRALLAFVVVAAVLVGIGPSMVSLTKRQPFAEERHPPGPIEQTPNPFDELAGGQARVTPIAVLSIDALVAEYRANEFAAAAKYENTEPLRLQCLVGDRPDGCIFVETSGTIRDLGRDESGVAYVRLATANKFDSVEARFDEAERKSLQALHRGQRVAVRCMVRYETSAGLSLIRCGVAPA